MHISIFDLFSIGIGPSSSHTVGPMRAASTFVNFLQEVGHFQATAKVKVELYGSLALTGHGHGTPKAVLLGLEGEKPESCQVDEVKGRLARIHSEKTINLGGEKVIPFDPNVDLVFQGDKVLPFHSNGMRFSAYDKDGEQLCRKVLYSIGGGFVVDHESASHDCLQGGEEKVPYPFSTCRELLEWCDKKNLRIRDVMWANELALRSEEELREGIMSIWQVMKDCVERGCREEGILPGGLKVQRRAASIRRKLEDRSFCPVGDPGEMLEWLSLFALAVNEENAAGGRVVTAPTNGAAGIIPAVGHYYMRFTPTPSEEGLLDYFLVSAAVGILYKLGASISAAEVGCQGEVGVACSMAAAGLAAALGANDRQIEEAAEIGMEHNLGLTCDPVGGLVQIPCIERNTMGAVKAVTAARLALKGNGSARVRLDDVIRTMLQTGRDMQSVYKETAQGGLAVNVTEC